MDSSSFLETKNEHEIQEDGSVDSFQKFIYDLFEKNGVLNDLRAYLRKHIVDVLKSANVGDVPACQKHFAQRLELTMQAINVLIVEYLMHSEFSYTLSVFISEIPLANMVFDFTNSLMKSNLDKSQACFNDRDIWSILNYLGMKLDSAHMNSMLEMYRREELPLLTCILKSLPLYYNDLPPPEQALTSGDSEISLNSTATLSDKPTRRRAVDDKCRRCSSCKLCHARLARLREKYRRKKKAFAKQTGSINSVNAKNLMNNISVVEGTLIEEIFEQIKTVYEAEVEMMRAEEQKKVQRSLADHALKLAHHRQEMEESFKEREQELERNVRQKKKFLWGLARSLREQHEQMTRAMRTVKQHTSQLTNKEEKIRSQLLEAEQDLKRRGEDMRAQISAELITLENNLDSMRQERETLHKQRSDLEQLERDQLSRDQLTRLSASAAVVKNTEHSEDSHETIGRELKALRKFIATHSTRKHLVETGTMTDNVPLRTNLELLNNEQGRISVQDDRVKSNQLVNDFKKQKNVNFSFDNIEDFYCEQRESTSNDPTESVTILQLRQENEGLKEYARVQAHQIKHLSVCAARLRASVVRPRTAPPAGPAAAPNNINMTGSANSLGWLKGAGEQLNLFVDNVPPRIVVPGDDVPFIGQIPDKRKDTRRERLKQWRRSLRRPPSPPSPLPAHNPLARSDILPAKAGPSMDSPQNQLDFESPPDSNLRPDITMKTTTLGKCKSSPQKTLLTTDEKINREKSPKSVLREAKEKLRTKTISPKHTEADRGTCLEKSPSSVLREAKLRLRKLQIEAQAVEQSYRHFRQRQIVGDQHGNTQSRSDHKVNGILKTTTDPVNDTQKQDIEKYLKEYHAKFNLTESHFAFSNNVTTNAKPIPKSLSSKDDLKQLKQDINNYLDTPLSEFRKYYMPTQDDNLQIENGPKESQPKFLAKSSERVSLDPSLNSQIEDIKSNNIDIEIVEAKKAALILQKNCKHVEHEILKNDINKIYDNLDKDKSPPSIDEFKEYELSTQVTKETENMLRVEVETVSHNTINVTDNEPDNLLVVVQSQIDALPASNPASEIEASVEQISGNMTILISPKKNSGDEQNSSRSLSPEHAAKLTRNDVFEAIFHADPVKAESSHDLNPKSSKEALHSRTNSEIGGELNKDNATDDDFSADVDNYNSLSENVSPISVKSPVDDNFWDN